MYSVFVRRGNIIHLGPDVVCDGSPTKTFKSASYGVRVQTHIHADHMCEWESSLFRNVFMTPVTKKLILAEQTGSSEGHRSNLKDIPFYMKFKPEGTVSEIELMNSGHMLGACMVSVSCAGKKYLYTSDFSWPLPPDALNRLADTRHDVLVIDATYGNPLLSRRNYTQEDVKKALLSIVSESVAAGTVKIVGHRGRLQRAYQMIEGEFGHKGIDFYGSPAFDKTVAVYHQHFGMAGKAYRGVDDTSSPIQANKLVFIDTRDQSALENISSHTTIIRLLETRSQSSLVAATDSGFQISMTDHADFGGTIQMIKHVNPRAGVITNGRYRSELAKFIREYLGIEACCAVMPTI